jgi:glucosamine-6-phosphate deaminase
MNISLNIRVFDSAESLAEHGADIITGIYNQCCQEGRPFVLGLAAGASPMDIYKVLIERKKNGDIQFSDCVTFCLDEYYPMPANSPMSFYYELSNIQNQLGIPEENRHFFKGDISPENISEHCMENERKICRAGGIDLQLLGVGRNGHIAFNEPGAESDSRSRMVELTETTRTDAVFKFGKLESVPNAALTMGISTILDAKNLLLIAEGIHKRKIMRQFIIEIPRSEIPVTFLKSHKKLQILVDAAASPKIVSQT